MAEKGMVVVADDHLNVRNILEFNLKRRGYDVTAASDGLTTLSLAHRLHPVLVILDIMMPGLDGFQVLEKMKTWPAEERPPVLILSARGTEQDIMRALQLGASDFIVKPFNMDILFQKIENIASGGGIRLESKRGGRSSGAPVEAPNAGMAVAASAPPSLIAVLPVPSVLSGGAGESFSQDVVVLLEGGVRRVVLDAMKVAPSFDSFAVPNLMKMIQEARGKAASVKWCASEETAKEFKEAGLAEHFEIFTSLEGVIRSFDDEEAKKGLEVEAEVDLLDLN